MPMIFDLKKQKIRDAIPGNCGNCKSEVWQSLSVLDDTYNVWMGKCPHCQALNFLSTNYGLRGYDSTKMMLELPYDEEVEANDLPKDIPTQGKKGEPANMHGSPAGEIYFQLTKGLK